jgi:hypothetical protein
VLEAIPDQTQTDLELGDATVRKLKHVLNSNFRQVQACIGANIQITQQPLALLGIIGQAKLLLGIPTAFFELASPDAG